MKKNLWLGIGAFLFSPIVLRAQTATEPIINATLEGKIVENKTLVPLEGSTIQIKGTTHKTSTDNKGKFYFRTGQKLPFTLIVTHVGFEPLELTVNTPFIEIPLRTESKGLDEVVVTGYGSQKRKDFTGSVASVSADAVKSTPISSFENILQGRAAGVQVTQTSGQPGAAVSIRIRGGNSLNGGNEPLYVIDGFPVYNDNADANAGAISGASINALSSLNPSDIESIDILKDASATSIYGSRGANGVILITTKRGKAGQNTISYDGYYGQQQVGKKIPLLTPQQFAQLKNDAVATSNEVVRVSGSGTIRALPFTQAQIDSLGGINRNWEDAAFRVAPVQNHQLNLSGGDEKNRYSLSGSYFNQGGILVGSDFQRYSARLNFERKFSNKFKVAESLTASETKAHEAPTGIVNTILAMRPDFPIYNDDGSFTLKQPGESALGNPIATLYQQINLTRTFRLLGNVYGEYKFVEGLTGKVSLGVDKIVNNQYRYLPATLNEGIGLNGVAYQGNKNVGTWLNENTLNYVKRFGDHSVDVLTGFTQQQYNGKAFVASAANFSIDNNTYNDLGSGTTLQSPSSTSVQWALKSFLGRLNYNYKEKYYFTLTNRADGSSRFGKNKKWGVFPSAAVSWTVSKEEFLKNYAFINTLKLRLSAGRTGNQEIGVYQSLPREAYYSYILGNTLVAGYAPASIANPDLGWETTTQYDAGLDLALFQNRVNLNIDAYYKKTTDLLLNVSIPATSGQLTALQNYGAIQNKGVDITLSTENLTGDFTWNTQVTYSLNRNKVLSLGDGVPYILSDPFIAQVGLPVGSFYVLKTDGLFQEKDDIAKLPKNKSVTLPGYQKYVDVDGDGTITQAGDRVIVGSSQPKFIGGISNNFSYKFVDLSFLLQGSYGNKLYNYTGNYLNLGTGYTNASTKVLDRWTPTNTNTTIKRAIEDPAPLPADIYIEDGSYLRLKNISLGFSLPSNYARALKLRGIRLYVSAQNLLTWTNYTGFDPEASRNEQTTLTQGFDNAVYPISKTYLAGISINL
ncbi:TonB-dependent receptor [Paraflavisolibacter sp. H34]|uniref:SusC/RagA family TonB-linked outer membrane protein n=1 Tax=Huijunlia imazamoxiresistens TaxID=3127457 RepID=UPI00301A3B48